jgi:hypothetical protein
MTSPFFLFPLFSQPHSMLYRAGRAKCSLLIYCRSASVHINLQVKLPTFSAVTMKNAVFCEINTQFVLHRRHISATEPNRLMLRFEVFTAAAMKNTFFWNMMACGSCKNRRFGGTYHLLLVTTNVLPSSLILFHEERYVPPKHRLLLEPHVFISKTMAFFINLHFVAYKRRPSGLCMQM